MNKTIVIGDIHGCINSLDKLLGKLPDNIDTLIFLGDYIDRGPNSKEVISRIIELGKTYPKIVTLKGNHEYMFLQYLEDVHNPLFLLYGGLKTLESYNIGLEEKNPIDHIPPDHLSFFRNLLLMWENDYAIFVHAGLQPGLHLTLQNEEWCLWVRDLFINSAYDFGKKVVFGHTVFHKPFIQSNKIGIDTGAVYGGMLTALILPDIKFLSVPGNPKSLLDPHFL